MRVFLLICIFIHYPCSSAAGNDSLRAKKIYSFSLWGEGGITDHLKQMPEDYLSVMVKGTGFDNYNLRMYDKPSHQENTAFGIHTGWKIKKFRSRVCNFAEVSGSMAFFTSKGGRGSVEITESGRIGKDTVRGVGPFDLNGVWVSPGFNLHSRPFFKSFAIAAGAEPGIFFARLGGQKDMGFISYWGSFPYYKQISVTTGRSALYSLATPVRIKYNLSCELNLELYYKPVFMMFPQSTFKPQNWTFFQHFGFMLRYKLDTQPAHSGVRRTDMFF